MKGKCEISLTDGWILELVIKGETKFLFSYYTPFKHSWKEWKDLCTSKEYKLGPFCRKGDTYTIFSDDGDVVRTSICFTFSDSHFAYNLLSVLKEARKKNLSNLS
jgi:hypothetical protein